MPKRTTMIRYLATTAILASAFPAAARDEVPPETMPPRKDSVFEGDYLSVGIGAGVGPSYDGSDDYIVFPGLLFRGRLKGIGIKPRASGIALDFVRDEVGKVGFDFGVAARVRANRASSVKDKVVVSGGKLKQAIEVGPMIGVEYEGLLNKYDQISLGSDVLFDVSGAHSGFSLSPGVSYVTPLNRGVAVQLSAGVQYADGEFSRYYYSVTPDQGAASGLPEFTADSGLTKASVTLAGGFDLNGNIEDGGFALVFIGSYNRMLGDAQRSPYTSIRGDANQWIGAMGVGYTF